MKKKPTTKPTVSTAKSNATTVATAARMRNKTTAAVARDLSPPLQDLAMSPLRNQELGKTPSLSSRSDAKSDAKQANGQLRTHLSPNVNAGQYTISVTPPTEVPWASKLLSTSIKWTSQKPMCPHFNDDGTWTNRCMEVRTIAGAAHDGQYNPDGWAVVEAMVRAGVPPDHGAVDGCTALTFLVAQLLDHSISRASADRLRQLIGLLLEHGANIDFGTGLSPRRLLEDAISNFIDWKIAFDAEDGKGLKDGPLRNLNFLSTVLLGDEKFFQSYCENNLEMSKISNTKSDATFLVKRADGEYLSIVRRTVEPNEQDGYLIGGGRYHSLLDANAFLRRYWDDQQGLNPEYWDQYSMYKNQHGCLRIYTVDHRSDPHLIWVEREDHVLKWVQIV